MAATEVKIFKDQLGRDISVNFPPKKIISLVPSQTELLFDLGLEEEVTGITKFCVHPGKWFRNKTRVGGTKKLNIEKIKSLQPDLIIGNREENDKTQIMQLAKDFPVWMSDVKTLQEALDMIQSVGALVNRENKASEIAHRIGKKFSEMKKNSLLHHRLAYFIWYNPLMVAASGTFINGMLSCCGFENAFAHMSRYPEINFEILKEINPEIIFLSSEPFPFRQKHIDEMKAACPNSKVMLVNGEYFSWYGSRLINAPEYFAQTLQQLLYR